MIKKIACIFILLSSFNSFATTSVNLYREPLSRLNQFSSLQGQKIISSTHLNNTSLQAISKTRQANTTTTRYQQIYKGIKIVGAQITVSTNASKLGLTTEEVNGRLFDNIELELNTLFNSTQAIALAKESYASAHQSIQIREESSQLQIRTNKENQLQLVYLVSFKPSLINDKPVWPFFIIDAQTGEILKQWNNIKTHLDMGPGGNEKTHEYWYGKDGLPGLYVTQNGDSCIMEDQDVKLVNVDSNYDWYGLLKNPVKYRCSNNIEDPINGSFSVGNDAYYFGHTIVNLFKNWYGLNALQDEQGRAHKLIMRVHFGKSYANAFWNGQSMNFGDGMDPFLYPLVSLDIAGHEVAHGFTEQHANLEYHDESGALNESFSDMAGQAARAYLLEDTPLLYNKAFITPNEVTWNIGETIIKPTWSMKALRFMNHPSLDGDSADCVDKKLARKQKSICAISYPELLMYAESLYVNDEEGKQSFIVHTASGVFNKAFYLMAKELGIKTAFHVMIVANTTYWTPTTDFVEGACGVIYAAQDLKINNNIIQSAFNKVGLNTASCIH